MTIALGMRIGDGLIFAADRLSSTDRHHFMESNRKVTVYPTHQSTTRCALGFRRIWSSRGSHGGIRSGRSQMSQSCLLTRQETEQTVCAWLNGLTCQTGG